MGRTLHFAGFNGHLKLQRESKDTQSSCLHFYKPHVEDESPDDVKVFTSVNHSCRQLSLLSATWCDIFFRSDGKIWHAGHKNDAQGPTLSTLQLPKGIDADDLKSLFGDPIAGIAGAVTLGGELLVINSLEEKNLIFHRMPLESGGKHLNVQMVAVGGDSLLYAACTHVDGGHAMSWVEVMQWDGRGTVKRVRSSPCPGEIHSLGAGSTSVVALTVAGQFFTAGSPLQASMLARSPTKSNPASELSSVDALNGIRIVKVCMSEWLAGALSADRDLYVWGGRGGGGLKIDSLPSDQEDVRLVDIAGGVDIVDFAIGMGHILVLTDNGELWGCGDNEYGQLGLGHALDSFVRDWIKVPSHSNEAEIETLVAGGYGNWIISKTGS